jgi:hypothetical protein
MVGTVYLRFKATDAFTDVDAADFHGPYEREWSGNRVCIFEMKLTLVIRNI